jgi:hypothetical protein
MSITETRPRPSAETNPHATRRRRLHDWWPLPFGEYLAACSVFVAVRERSMWLAVPAIFVVAIAAWQLHRTVRAGAPANRTTRWRLEVISALVTVGVALIVVWYLTDKSDGWGFFGVATAYLGVGLLVEELRRSRRASQYGIHLLAVCGVAVAAGLVGISPNSPWWAKALLVVGVVLAPVGFNMASAAANRVLESVADRTSKQLAVGGAAVYLGSLALMFALGLGWTYVVVLGVAVAVLMSLIAMRANSDVVIVVAAVALVWTVAHRAVPLPEALTPQPGESAAVAMGDSFMSGEGATRYYEGTNTKRQNECRRAPTAYAPLLVLQPHDGFPDRLAFFGCSGATAEQITDKAQYPGEPVGGTPWLVDGKEVRGLHQLAQVTELRRAVDVEFVLLSIGGNDALFGTIARTCLLPGDCSELGGAWLDHLADVEATLRQTYAKVRAALPDVPVAVVPYPIPLAERRCHYSPFSKNEHRFLQRFTTELNQVVRRAADTVGFHYVDTMPGALADRRVCDGPAGRIGVNVFAAHGVAGLTEEAMNPANWFHNSMHPNSRGHAAMHGALLTWLRQHHPLPAPAAPTGVPDRDVIDIKQLFADPGHTCRGVSDVEDCTNDWMLATTSALLLTRGWLLLGAVCGAWLVALQVIRAYRKGPRPV